VTPDPIPHATQSWRIEGPTQQRVLEFKTFEFPLVGAAMMDLPASPGSVRRDPSGRAMLLHFAPGRFLMPVPTPDIVRRLDALQVAGVGAAFDVDGKWQALALMGPSAEHALSSAINLTQALGDRECAALQLFDCPAVLARRANAFDVWVEASYATALRGLLTDTISSQIARVAGTRF
jgi:heterotetrameric sarcosine oxidase gamma subunit